VHIFEFTVTNCIRVEKRSALCVINIAREEEQDEEKKFSHTFHLIFHGNLKTMNYRGTFDLYSVINPFLRMTNFILFLLYHMCAFVSFSHKNLLSS